MGYGWRAVLELFLDFKVNILRDRSDETTLPSHFLLNYAAGQSQYPFPLPCGKLVIELAGNKGWELTLDELLAS